MTRFLIYSHDTYGLGHLRRCTLLAGGLTASDVDNQVLLVTGSAHAQSFRLPDRVDTVKLPVATKDLRGGYQARRLSTDLATLVNLRASLIRSAIEAYRPDVVLVDHAPLGMGGELLPTLDLLRSNNFGTKLVLELRDIIDDVARVEHDWSEAGTWNRLNEYDEILVYGDPAVPTTAQELDLTRRLHVPITHTGYVAPGRAEALAAAPFVLVTAGGGGDGQDLLRCYLDALEGGAVPHVRSVIVTGPLLSSRRRAEFLVRAERLPRVKILEFTNRMRTYIASATGVISMAGYNTVAELLSADVPALLVPRDRPRLEQSLRSQRLAPLTRLNTAPQTKSHRHGSLDSSNRWPTPTPHLLRRRSTSRGSPAAWAV